MQRQPTGSLYIWDDYRCYEVSNDDLVADILEARLWRAVREWAEYACWVSREQNDEGWTIVTVEIDGSRQRFADLPAAAHAIAEWCKANRPTPPAQ